MLHCQPPSNSGNHRDIPDPSPHRYLAHILSHHHGHCMCFSEDMGSHKPLNVTFDTHRLNISVVLCCQPPPNSGNHRHIPDPSLHRYLTRILSHNHGHRMCIGEDMGNQTHLNFTFIHTDSTFQWFYAVNFRQTPAIRDISRSQLHTGTPHVFCHTTTVIACVLVKIWATKHT